MAARTYQRIRPQVNLSITDSDNTVDEIWSEDRLYPNLVAQVKLGLFNNTETPMPVHGATKNNLVTGRRIYDYIEKYVEDHDLLHHIPFNGFFEKLERCSHG